MTTTQRWILVMAIFLGGTYGWLAGALPMMAADTAQAPSAPAAIGLETATFAAGCFWSVESAFDKVRGVVSTTPGYTGGHVEAPTYEQVSQGGTGHAEAVEIVFDPKVVTYDQVLGHFWRNVDPFAARRQFCDAGEQYRPEIFVRSDAQRASAAASKEQIQRRFRQPIVVQIVQAGAFYPAEAYHQDYARKNPVQYHFYRWNCGRDARLRDVWGDE